MHVRELIKGMDAIIPDGVSIQDFAIVTDTNNKTAKKILDVFIKNDIGKFEDDTVYFELGDKIKAAFLIIENGEQIEQVSEHLDWKDFEGLVAQILEEKGFATMKNMILTKPRMEIDVVGINHGIAMLIDCKHWKKLSQSSLNTIVEKQIKRVKHYVSKTNEAIAVPIIVTLYHEQINFINRVPIVPVQQLSSFIDEFYGNLDKVNTIEK